MPRHYLRILLDSLIDGDGCIHKNSSDKYLYRSYITGSKELADDVLEIALKLGYTSSISYVREEDDIYVVNIPSSDIGKYPTLDTLKFGNKVEDRRKCISREYYKGTVWCFEVPNEFLVVRMYGKVLIAGNTFANASVGIEAMIERLQTFRKEMSNWIEEEIYKPEAIRQGFLEKNPDTGEEEPIYPKIKWNSMHLRDRQQDKNFTLQLYEKGLLSAQTVLEEFEYDPDQEIERKRYDALQMMAVGEGMGGMGGMGGEMGGGMPGMGGDMGGGMGGDMGGMGGMPGMGGEAPISPGGGGEGGMGGMPGMGGAPTMAGSTNALSVDPSKYGGRILKEKTRNKIDQQNSQIYKKQEINSQGDGTYRDEKGRVVFTSIERALIPRLKEYQKNGLIRYPIVPQYRIQHGDQEYSIDFAIPHLKVAIEADGEIFHESPHQKTKDNERDMVFSQMGWTTVRLTEKQIEKQLSESMKLIVKTIMQKELFLKNQAKKIES